MNERPARTRRVRGIVGRREAALRLSSAHGRRVGESWGLYAQHFTCPNRTATDIHVAHYYESSSFNPRLIVVSQKSEYRGLAWHKNAPNWQVGICIGGKRRTVGYFADEELAAKAYDEAARKQHGRTARLNFPSCTTAEPNGDAKRKAVQGDPKKKKKR